MKARLALAALAALALAGTARLAALDGGMPGVAHPERARVDYMLKCQGCHQPDGRGNTVNTPPLKGEVAKFLHVPGGRRFLAQVPGVASTDLDDERLAEVLNWTLYRFDAGNLPRDFTPYTPAEVGGLRKTPLRLDRAPVRARLMARIEKKSFTH